MFHEGFYLHYTSLAYISTYTHTKYTLDTCNLRAWADCFIHFMRTSFGRVHTYHKYIRFRFFIPLKINIFVSICPAEAQTNITKKKIRIEKYPYLRWTHLEHLQCTYTVYGAYTIRWVCMAHFISASKTGQWIDKDWAVNRFYHRYIYSIREAFRCTGSIFLKLYEKYQRAPNLVTFERSDIPNGESVRMAFSIKVPDKNCTQLYIHCIVSAYRRCLNKHKNANFLPTAQVEIHFS